MRVLTTSDVSGASKAAASASRVVMRSCASEISEVKSSLDNADSGVSFVGGASLVGAARVPRSVAFTET